MNYNKTLTISYLIVNQVNNSMLQHLWRFSQPLDSSGLIGIKLGCWNLHSFFHRFREHGSTDSLRTSLIQLDVHIYMKNSNQVWAEYSQQVEVKYKNMSSKLQSVKISTFDLILSVTSWISCRSSHVEHDTSIWSVHVIISFPRQRWSL